MCASPRERRTCLGARNDLVAASTVTPHGKHDGDGGDHPHEPERDQFDQSHQWCLTRRGRPSAGDTVLIEVARRLRGCARGVDVVARLGGDEFAIALCGASHDVMSQVADRVLLALEPAVRWDGRELLVGVSVGRAVGRWSSPDELIVAADSSMYVAKRDRRVAIGPLATNDRGESSPLPVARP